MRWKEGPERLDWALPPEVEQAVNGVEKDWCCRIRLKIQSSPAGEHCPPYEERTVDGMTEYGWIDPPEPRNHRHHRCVG